jgi:type I restriction enzyme, S subunit
VKERQRVEGEGQRVEKGKTPSDLPIGWENPRLGDAFDIERGGSPRPIEDFITEEENGINWIKIGDTKGISKYIFATKEKIKPEGVSRSRMVYEDDFVLSNSMSFGRPYIMKTSGCIHDGWLVIRTNKEIVDTTYLYYVLSSSAVYRQFSGLAKGSTVKNLNIEAAKQVDIPFPPLAEQHRIVAKIEELFSSLDKGIEDLKTVQQQLKVYRQAVLKWAFEGKLTAEWRDQNKTHIGSADTLLNVIQVEREKHYLQLLAEWQEAKNEDETSGKNSKTQRKPIAPKQLPPLTKGELDELPELPDGWGWSRAEEICSPDKYSIGIGPFGSNLKVSDYRDKGIPLIFVKNITRSDFRLDLKYIEETKYQELLPHTVKALDLLITKMGDPPGDCEIYPANARTAVLTADCLKIRIWGEFLERKFFKFYVNSQSAKKQLGLITSGVAQKKISVDRFKTVCFPLPSRKEQQLIVAEIEFRLSVADKIEETITSALKQAESLRQSILKKAFEGRLVPQDPNDEPASALLERITADRNTGRAAAPPPRRPGRKAHS